MIIPKEKNTVIINPRTSLEVGLVFFLGHIIKKITVITQVTIVRRIIGNEIPPKMIAIRAKAIYRNFFLSIKTKIKTIAASSIA
jgi:hypothetical protein